MHVDEEIVLPELTTASSEGFKEGRMDIVTSRPGGVTRFLLDIRTADSRADRYSSACAAFAEVAREKATRYGGFVHPVPVEHRGRLGPQAVEIMGLLATEAALLTGQRPSSLVRKWRRALALVCAFEAAEVQRSSCLRFPE